jgi:hypothetical protein
MSHYKDCNPWVTLNECVATLNPYLGGLGPQEYCHLPAPTPTPSGRRKVTQLLPTKQGIPFPERKPCAQIEDLNLGRTLEPM